MQRTKNTQAGMTLVELMVAMVISTIVIFFLFSIQTRMSRAYKGQGTVAEINQNLQAAKAHLLKEIRMAGYGLDSLGNVQVASTIDTNRFASGFSVSNDAFGDGNDSFRIMAADPLTEIVVTGFSGGNNFVDTLEPASEFLTGSIAILMSRTDACLIKVTGVNTQKIHFNPSGAPYNETPQNPHCQDLKNNFNQVSNPVTIAHFTGVSYRIDPDRATEGYLQMSPSGEVVADDWIDQGVGFTNMQIATRYFESGDAVDRDGDGDPERDWYSGDNQAAGDASRPADAVLIQASLSIEGRSPYGTRGSAASSVTPAFTDLSNVDHNPRGDWGQDCAGAATDPCGINLATTPDASRPDRYQGEYIYRSTTSIVDLRNMGVGQ